jgi:hypothetical protein
MVNNGSLHYDHDRDGTHTQLAGCEAQLRNKDHDIYVAIRYHNYKLTVKAAYFDSPSDSFVHVIADFRFQLTSTTKTHGKSVFLLTEFDCRLATFSACQPRRVTYQVNNLFWQINSSFV